MPVAERKHQWYLKNRERILLLRKETHKKYPWKQCFKNIKSRCEDTDNNRYFWYGGRGIKCLIVLEEVKFLWFRDKAYLMKKPSINRKNNNGNYTLDNCEFIELGKNVEEMAKRVHSIAIIQKDLEGNFIKEWPSAKEAGRQLGIKSSNITRAIRGGRPTAGGSIWAYKGELNGNETHSKTRI